MPSPTQAVARTELARDLGAGHTVAVVVGTVIGSGVFLVPAEMTQAAGSAKLVYLAWLVGGLLSFFGALTYAELGAMKPQAGGEYIYIRDAYGPMAGFLYAWTWLLIAKPASIATLATGFVRVLGNFPALRFLAHNFVSLPFPVTYGQLMAISSAILISVLNYIGVKRAGDFQLVFTFLKVAIILGIVVIGFTYSGGSWHNFASSLTGTRDGMAGFMAALVAALWAYDGWNDLNMVSGEIRDPEHNIPGALIFGVASVSILYMLVSASVQFVLPVEAIAASLRPASDAMAMVLGSLGAGIVSAGMALSMLVAMNGTVMSGARVPFAVARDRYFFSALAEVHPRFHTPSVAIVVQGILSVILLLVGGNFRQFFSLTIFAEWLFYMITTSTIFVFRQRSPDVARPYQVWGYPVVPILFVLASAVLLYYTFTDNLLSSAFGCILILAGIPVFYGFARQRAAGVPR
jgi:APA family basic amino acid/polyamine antiporter